MKPKTVKGLEGKKLVRDNGAISFPSYKSKNFMFAPSGALMVASGIRDASRFEFAELCRAGKVMVLAEMPEFVYRVTSNAGEAVTVTDSEIRNVVCVKNSINWGCKDCHQTVVVALFKKVDGRVGNEHWGWFKNMADFQAQYNAQFKAAMVSAKFSPELQRAYLNLKH